MKSIASQLAQDTGNIADSNWSVTSGTSAARSPMLLLSAQYNTHCPLKETGHFTYAFLANYFSAVQSLQDKFILKYGN